MPAPQKHQDDTARMDAALLYANGDFRSAINTLIARVNASNGYCDVRVWLELFDIYQVKNLRSPFEKLAQHFSDRFGLSTPSWEPELVEHTGGGDKTKKRRSGAIRCVLLVDGSPLDINADKIRDVLKAARQHKECRLDLARMQLDSNEERMHEELEAVLDVMRRIRRLHVPTVLMGETHLMERAARRVKEKHDDRVKEDVYWMLLLEILQWRGEKDLFEDTVCEYIDLFEYCPVGFEDGEVIAREPGRRDGERSVAREVLEASAPNTLVISSPTPDMERLTSFLDEQRRRHRPSEVRWDRVVQWDASEARSLASLFQVLDEDIDAERPPRVVFSGCLEPIASLMDATGLSGYADIVGRHVKLQEAAAKRQQKEA